ncbi:MAG: tetratricopeptide repeat protein, partial [Planctomycetota bacterium]
METITEAERKVDLFAEELPAMEEINELAQLVHSSESNQLAFAEQVEANLPKTGRKAAPAAGIGLFILGRYAESIGTLNKARDCKEKFMYLAFALRETGRWEEAIESCANLENVSAEYHYQRGRLQEALGLYEEAMESYKTALDLSPNHRKTLFYLAYRYDLSGNEEAAIDYYKQIAKTKPIYVSALMNLAVLYEDAGKFNKAAQCVEKVLNAHPTHQRAIMFEKDIQSSKTMVYDEEKEKKKTHRSQILETPISDFELSVRSRNCLKKMNIRTLGDLLNISEVELLSYKNFGETSLREIKNILESKNLHLGMGLEESQVASTEVAEYSEVAADEVLEEILNKSVDDLQLSVRARKCLQKLNMHTLRDLTQKTEAELLGCKNFGVTSLNEIKKAISNLGLSLRS